MKAFLLSRYGKNEKLHLTETPKPVPQADEVLIEVHAAGSTSWIPKSETASSS
jgi:NADPH:quinone reductase-like Zn-dependent oxidoreductase